ncbi:aldo/keto reductase [Phanerochaete sordida]|uniref:Aldo/keto reductase n=1 Tax=Phanerochaete sordida TaxID=48140 RepID=A0A9P3G3M1_9APHY|nr:aldo/keto reductase [Phanerochaete sordida]
MTVQSVTTLGGTASHIKVGKVAHGLLLMTWTTSPTPDEVAFEAIKAGIDSMPPGVKMLLNSSEFYSPEFGPASLELLSRFYEKYPDEENLRRSVTDINAALRGKKRLDLFECARIDPNFTVEQTIGALAGLVKEGLFDHIGMSECSAATLRRGHAVHPVAAVEIEVNAWSMEPETQSVLKTAEELGVAVMAYAPLGRGFLTGQFKKPDDIPEGDMRRNFIRFRNPEYFQHNLTLVDKLTEIAEKKGVTPTRLCIAWVASLGEKVIPMPGSRNAKRTIKNAYSADTKVTKEDSDAIWQIINNYEVKGDRYFGVGPQAVHLWG